MLTSKAIAGMQAVQSAHMMDECVLLVRSTTQDGYGVRVEVFADGLTVKCGLSFVTGSGGGHTGQEVLGSSDVPMQDRQLRLPHGTDVSPYGRVRVTKRFGVDETEPTTYNIVGPAQTGPSGVVVKLSEITD